MNKVLYILGTRGVPAKHGGFETFAEKISCYLANKGWKVFVYCQETEGELFGTTHWKNVTCIHVPVSIDGSLGSFLFDLKATFHACSQSGLFLVLGYNTALFNILQRFIGQNVLINMDGIEWRREKWSVLARAWFWVNERIACFVGSHLIADHPEIKAHLVGTKVPEAKITMLPYGADEVLNANIQLIEKFGLERENYSLIIARPEPENSILEMVRAFSRVHRGHKLVVLGDYSPQKKYHRLVLHAADSEVIFPGAIYEAELVQALRYYARFYLHGHQVGGTNPSLVEALGAGCAVIAHDNRFNRWVAGDGAVYFKDEFDCAKLLDSLLGDDLDHERMKSASRTRFQTHFTWDRILQDYEDLLVHWYSSK